MGNASSHDECCYWTSQRLQGVTCGQGAECGRGVSWHRVTDRSTAHRRTRSRGVLSSSRQTSREIGVMPPLRWVTLDGYASKASRCHREILRRGSPPQRCWLRPSECRFTRSRVATNASPYFKRRARNWRVERLRVNALAPRPGRSRFAACVRRFAARGCVRGGLSRWASGMLGPSAGRPSRACSRIVSPRIERPRAPICLWFTVPEAEMHELISNRGASAKLRTARRGRKAAVSGDESGRGASRSLMNTLIPFTCQPSTGS